MSLTLSVEIDSPAAVSMVLDNMDGASDPNAKLDDKALVRWIISGTFLYILSIGGHRKSDADDPLMKR